VLALKPQVLVLDEPTAGLDPKGRRELLRTLSQWHAEEGRSIVLATHNMEDIAELSTRVYVLVGGQIVWQGSPREVFSQPEVLMQYGLAVPSATETMHMLRHRGYAVPTEVLTNQEAARAIEALFHG
jgi:energy-coupling factor transport system ATP-binding protein